MPTVLISSDKCMRITLLGVMYRVICGTNVKDYLHLLDPAEWISQNFLKMEADPAIGTLCLIIQKQVMGRTNGLFSFIR